MCSSDLGTAMKAYIGINEVPVNVKVVLDMGEPIVIEVRDVRNGLDVRGYLEQTTLERLAQDWMIENDSEAEVCF